MTSMPIDIPLHLLSDDARPRARLAERAERAGWSDTVPTCFRSEAFAEDLLDHPTGPARHNAAPCDTPSSSWPFWSLRRWA